MSKHPRILALLVCALCGLFCSAAIAADFHVVHRFHVGGDGGWDYLKVDPDSHRIYMSRGNHVMIVDEASGNVLGDIPNTNGVHGIALAPELGKGFISDGADDSVTVFDLKTLKATSTIKTTGGNPDSIIYDPATKRVFTFNGKGSNATAIDATAGKVVGTVTLGGKPEEAVLDGKGTVFVNLEDKSSMVGFDAKSLAVKTNWPLAPCEGPSAIAMDTAHRRVFAACDKVMVVVNADNGKVIASPPIGGDPDGNGFDPGNGMLFASCREGLVSVIHQDSPDKYSVITNITTQFGTRTMTLDSKTHHVFTVTADFRAAGAATPSNPHPRPQPIPGSFVLLEIGQ